MLDGVPDGVGTGNFGEHRRFRRPGVSEWIAPACCILLLALVATPVAAQSFDDSSDSDGGGSSSLFSHDRNYLLGNWGGTRDTLASKGVAFDFFYVTDLQGNPVGGPGQNAAGWGRARGTMDVDFGKLTGWKGLTFHVTGLWQFGTNLGGEIGTLANPSGLVSAHATRLDSWWFQQALFNNKLFIKAGQFAGLDFYGNQEYGASYLIEPLDYALGNLFPTTFESFDPAATPAFELRVAPVESFYVKAAALAGNRNPYEQDIDGFHFAIRDSAVFVFEAGYLFDQGEAAGKKARDHRKVYPGKYKVGAAYNDGRFTDAAGNLTRGNHLVYVDANQAVYRQSAGSNRGLDLLFSYDWSPEDVNRFNSQTIAGARYNAPFSGRSQDSVAFAFIYSRIADPYRFIGTPPVPLTPGTEKATELNYLFQITRYWLVQPAFQYYVDVGGNSSLHNAAVLGFRTKVTF